MTNAPSAAARSFPSTTSNVAIVNPIMAAVGVSRPCTHCNRAKRKCDRTTPSCGLCRKKQLDCVYPSERPSQFVAVDIANVASSRAELEFLNFESVGNENVASNFLPLGLSALDIPSSFNSTLNINRCGTWFLAPETFEVDHTTMPIPPNFKLTDLNEFVQLIEDWMTAWVVTGCNPFIHAHLYPRNLPSCLQIAFSTLSAYQNRNQATKDIILNTVNDQAGALMSRYDIETETLADLLEDLAHIHALLVYQMVGLFDGDIRSRHLAEQREPKFARALDCALEKASKIWTLHPSTFAQNHLTLSLDNETRADESLWRTWIILESLRRTWLVGKGMSATYDGLKQGWTPCNGDIMFTSREGLWSAKSALDWNDMCSKRDVRFGGRFHAEYLFEVAPDEVDEFGKVMLNVTFGRDRSMRWLRGMK